MCTGWTVSMKDLARFLADEVERTSYRTVAEKVKVSKGAIENIVKQQNKQPPELGTLKAIADAYGLLLWEVIEMAGMNLGGELDSMESASRLVSLIGLIPEIDPVIRGLVDLPPKQRRVAVRYIMAYLRFLSDESGAGESDDS